MVVSHYQAGRERRKAQWEALVVVILVNAALLFLFVYAPLQPPTVIPPVRNSTLLDLSAVAESNPQFLKWLEYHDPTLFVRPDSEHGYGAWGSLNQVHQSPPPSRATTPPEPDQISPKEIVLEVSANIPKDWQALPSYMALSISNLAQVPQQQYPQVSFNGHPLNWQLPGELVESARRQKLNATRIVLRPNIDARLPIRWDLSNAGGSSREWRNDLVRRLSPEIAEKVPTQSGELLIQWRPEGRE